MKKNTLRNSIAGIIVGTSALMAPMGVSAATITPNDECAKELLLSYFPEPIVTDTLKRFNVPQDKWAGIVKSLASKDKEVVKLVEQKAAAMNPNPLKDPQQRQSAVKLFRETLLQVFSDSMKDNGQEDSSQFQAMLDDIQQQKAKKFAMCMDKQKSVSTPATTNQVGSPDVIKDKKSLDSKTVKSSSSSSSSSSSTTNDSDDSDEEDSDDDSDDSDDNDDSDDDSDTSGASNNASATKAAVKTTEKSV